MVEESVNFPVKLLRDKSADNTKMVFREGQIVSAKKNPNGSVYIMGYPSLTLGDNDYEIHIPEATFWKLLLQ